MNFKNLNSPGLVFALNSIYIFHGAASIIIALNMAFIAAQLETDILGVAAVIGARGVGRLIGVPFTGFFKGARDQKRIILLGVFSMLVFFLGIALTKSLLIATVLGALLGFGNTFLDVGVYPAHTELNPKLAGSLSMLTRGFISIGQFLLPLLVAFIIARNLDYRVSFFLCAAALLFIAIFIAFRQDFGLTTSEIKTKKRADLKKLRASFDFRTIAALLFAFFITGTFIILGQWLPIYAERYGGFSATEAPVLVSVFGIASFVSVFATSYFIARLGRSSLILKLYTILVVVAIGVLLIFETPLAFFMAAFSIGAFAAAGLWQLVISALLNLHKENKGFMAAAYSASASTALMLVPIITAALERSDIRNVFIFNFFIALGSFLLAIPLARLLKSETNSN